MKPTQRTNGMKPHATAVLPAPMASVVHLLTTFISAFACCLLLFLALLPPPPLLDVISCTATIIAACALFQCAKTFREVPSNLADDPEEVAMKIRARGSVEKILALLNKKEVDKIFAISSISSKQLC